MRAKVDVVDVRTSHRSLRTVTIGAAGVVIAGLLASPVSAFGVTHRSVPYARVSHAAKVPNGARQLGAADTSKQINGAIALASRNPAGLHQDALAVSDPRSPRFHQYLPRGAFAARYGATDTTIAAVRRALGDAHLTVTSVSANHLFVHFSANVGQAESAFRTHIASFRMANGRTGAATTGPVSLPASIAPNVISVLGLNTLLKPSSSLERGSKPGTPSPRTQTFQHFDSAPQPCAQATEAATQFGGLTDDQIAHAYGVDGLYKDGDIGAGQTIAIYELEPFSTDDLSKFNTCYFGKAQAAAMASRLTIKNVDGGPGDGEGSGESILDVDDVSGLAPGANIEVYQAPNDAIAAMDETNQIVQDDTANVVTTSWGFCEQDEANLDPGYINVGNQLYEQAALQGQTWLASSGDAGSDGCAYQSASPGDPTLSTGDPGTQPFVVGVGGTTITDARNKPVEQVWNDGNAGGGAGGGVSSFWSAPSWQLPFNDKDTAASAVTDGGLSPCPQSADGSMCRETPDVSLQADEYTGAITVYIEALGGWNTFGGTSSSAPLWAAILADINASSGCQATGPLGFVAPSLYAIASIPAQRDASFNDVTVGNNDVYDLFNGKFFAAHSGYDMASGLGTPIVTSPNGHAGLATYLCAMAGSTETSRPTISNVAPNVVSTTPSGPVTITGTGFTGAKALSIGGYPVSAAGWNASSDTTITVTAVPTAAQAGNGGGGPQDGSGRALINVTGSSGATNAVTPTASLLYVDGTAASPVPSVNGVSGYGGPQPGGNTITVFGSGFTNSGPDQITKVTIGGVPVAPSDVAVVNSTTLTIKVPAYSSGTKCASGDDEVNDVCQAQVVVSNANGGSDTATIQPPYEGDQSFFGGVGAVVTPKCVQDGTCEIVPATTEYDYYPKPTITSITTTQVGASPVWASEQGDTVATIDGTGFDFLGILSVDIGDPTNPDNQDINFLSVTPTELVVVLNGLNPSTNPVVKNVAVESYGGISAPTPISYAGVPKVSAVSPPYAPDGGGGDITITGKGFAGVAPADGGELAYVYADQGAATEQLSGYAAKSSTEISATTPGSNPGAFVVTVCTITFCSEPNSFKQFNSSLIDFYEPGDPVVTGISATHGPASGGTKVAITGHNLSDAVKVQFGTAVAEASSAPQLLTNGSNTEIDAVSPPGKAGSTVHIVVTTVESIAEGHPSAPRKAATFSYRPSVPAAPRSVTAKAHGKSVTVRWKPPLSDGGHAITHYYLRAVALKNSPKKGAKAPAPVTLSRPASARTAILHRLAAGWTYYIKVQAVNSLGRGLTGTTRRAFAIHDPA